MSTDQQPNFDDLVSQAQIAHRLIAGFYQRLLPTIQQVTQQFELTFYEWTPTVTSRPCKKSMNPADSWAWDMLPMMATIHRFLRSEGPDSAVGDVALDLFITFDSNYSNRDKWSRLQIAKNQQPDATNMPVGEALVELYVGRCEKHSKTPLKELWMNAKDLNEEEQWIGRWQNIGTHFNAVYLKMQLAEFIANPPAVVEQVRSLLSRPGPALEQASA
ncbi:hypothetical protein [Comamonas testosteroni]|uniref:hypothetical protein n=1 Tax=Comamonas testosteroni TaxID=285 RepID=UPI00391A69C6